jgi:hypothetical protein
MDVKDAYAKIQPTQTLAIAARTNGTVNGTAVDRYAGGAGFQDALVVIHTGTLTDGVHTFELQDSDDGTNFDPVADEFLQGTEPATVAASDDNKIFLVGYKGIRQYLRVSVTTTGATTGGVFGAQVVLASPRVAPVN